MLHLKTKIRLADKCSFWPNWISVFLKDHGNVSAPRSSFRPPVIDKHPWLVHLSPSYFLWFKKAEVYRDPGEHGGDVRAAAGGLARREDGQVQHNPRTRAQLLDTFSGQGPITESLIKIKWSFSFDVTELLPYFLVLEGEICAEFKRDCN